MHTDKLSMQIANKKRVSKDRTVKRIYKDVKLVHTGANNFRFIC